MLTIGRSKSYEETVYESLLREYTEIRKADLKKTETAREKIAEADKTIETNKRLMEDATTTGDMLLYATLKSEANKAEETRKFYKGVVAKAEKTPCIAPEAARALYSKANAEIERVKQEYNNAMVEALKPIVELSNDAWSKLYMLYYAKNRIESNLEHKSSGFTPNILNTMHLMSALDKIMQTDEYKKLCADVDPVVKRDLFRKHEWWSPATAAFQEEAAKWI